MFFPSKVEVPDPFDGIPTWTDARNWIESWSVRPQIPMPAFKDHKAKCIPETLLATAGGHLRGYEVASPVPNHCPLLLASL